jgi:hypothetical protein
MHDFLRWMNPFSDELYLLNDYQSEIGMIIIFCIGIIIFLIGYLCNRNYTK